MMEGMNEQLKAQEAALQKLLALVGAETAQTGNPDRLVLGERMWYLLRYTK